MGRVNRSAPILCRDCLRIYHGTEHFYSGCKSQRLISHGELEDLFIAHIDCDAFYASVEKRDNPALNDKPLIVGHPGGRGVVTTACYIARQFGVRSAMPMFKALAACPNAVVIPPNMEKYRVASSEIRAIFLKATDIIEPVSLDEAYLDLSADIRTDPRPAPVLLAEIAKRIEIEVGITVSIGLSANKFLAKLASDLEKPRGFSIIGSREAVEFLRPLSIRKINGVGKVTAEKMEARGIHTIGDLQAMSEFQLTTQFGKFGHRLVDYVKGRDPRKVTPSRGAKSLSAETTFRNDISDLTELKEAAFPLCERVAKGLVAKDLAGSCVVLKLKTSDFQTITRNYTLKSATQRASVIVAIIIRLLEREADGRSFRLIGAGMSELVPGIEADPPDLFEG